MSGKHGVTFMTRKPFTAAFELNGYDIALVVIMSAACLRIDIHTEDGSAADLATRR